VDLPEVKANKIGINTLKARIRNSGWTVEEAINKPVHDKSPPTYTYNGITKTIKQWSIDYDVNYDNLYSRLIQLKWDFNKAVSEPVILGSKPTITHTHNGVTKTISELAKEYGIKYDKLYDRLVEGNWDLDRAVNTP
jgi:hypothetical protein